MEQSPTERVQEAIKPELQQIHDTMLQLENMVATIDGLSANVRTRVANLKLFVERELGEISVLAGSISAGASAIPQPTNVPRHVSPVQFPTAPFPMNVIPDAALDGPFPPNPIQQQQLISSMNYQSTRSTVSALPHQMLPHPMPAQSAYGSTPGFGSQRLAPPGPYERPASIPGTPVSDSRDMREDARDGSGSPTPAEPKSGPIAMPKYSMSLRSSFLTSKIGMPKSYNKKDGIPSEVGHVQGLLPNYKCEGSLVGHKNAISAICTQGAFLFTASQGTMPGQYEIKMWDLVTFQCLATLEGHTDHVTAIRGDGNTIVSASLDGTVRVWNIQSLEAVCTWAEHAAGVACLTIPAGTVYSGSHDQTIKVWSLHTMEFLGTFTGHTDAVLALEHFERILLSGCADGSIKVWDLDSMMCVRTLQGHTGPVLCLETAPEGFFSGSLDTTIRAWDWQNLECMRVLKGHQDAVNDIIVAQHSSGTMLVSCSRDATLRTWTLKPLKQLGTMQKHQGEVIGLAKHNQRLFSASADRSVRVWK